MIFGRMGRPKAQIHRCSFCGGKHDTATCDADSHDEVECERPPTNGVYHGSAKVTVIAPGVTGNPNDSVERLRNLVQLQRMREMRKERKRVPKRKRSELASKAARFRWAVKKAIAIPMKRSAP